MGPKNCSINARSITSGVDDVLGVWGAGHPTVDLDIVESFPDARGGEVLASITIGSAILVFGKRVIHILAIEPLTHREPAHIVRTGVEESVIVQTDLVIKWDRTGIGRSVAEFREEVEATSLGVVGSSHSRVLTQRRSCWITLLHSG